MEGSDLGGDETKLSVVRKIKVHFKPSIDDGGKKLYVLQYPLRPMWRPYELDERCGEVRVEPGTGELELDYLVDTNSKNYSRNVGISSPKQTLASSGMLSTKPRYAVGILRGNKLYLNPVDAVVQLRPVQDKHGDENVTMASKKEWVRLEYHGVKSGLSKGYLVQMMGEESTSAVQE